MVVIVGVPQEECVHRYGSGIRTSALVSWTVVWVGWEGMLVWLLEGRQDSSLWTTVRGARGSAEGSRAVDGADWFVEEWGGGGDKRAMEERALSSRVEKLEFSEWAREESMHGRRCTYVSTLLRVCMCASEKEKVCVCVRVCACRTCFVSVCMCAHGELNFSGITCHGEGLA